VNTFLNIKRDTVFLIIIIVGFLLTVLAFGALYFAVPDPQVFNSAVEKIFVENDFTQQTDLKLLEVLAQSGSLFEGSIALYSKIIFTLFFVILTVMMICVALIFSNIELRKQFDLLQDSSFNAQSIELLRSENSVQINGDWFQLTSSNIETLSVLLECGLDDEYISGAALESILSGKNEIDCDDNAGAMRIKRLRDNLGGQIIASKFIKHVPSKGYQVTSSKDNIKLG
jgi:DNA-binding winged helix-turn-helix (wHTH) protein